MPPASVACRLARLPERYLFTWFEGLPQTVTNVENVHNVFIDSEEPTLHRGRQPAFSRDGVQTPPTLPVVRGSRVRFHLSTWL